MATNVLTIPNVQTRKLQPYLFNFLLLKEVDTAVSLALCVTREAGIYEQTLTTRIVDRLDMVDIPVDWKLEESPTRGHSSSIQFLTRPS